MRPFRIVSALVAVAGFATVAAIPAAAVDAEKPTPCTGAPLLVDPAGDQNYVPGQGFGEPFASQPANMDVEALFFNYRNDKDGKKVLTANIQIANMDQTVIEPPASNGGNYYYVIYSYGDAVKFVALHNTGSALEYEYGTIDASTGTYTTDGTTTGAVFEGPHGIVQIDVPAEVGGKAGDKLTGAIVTVDGIDFGTDHGNGFNNHADVAPDDADVLEPNGKDYTTTDCPPPAGGGTPPPPTGDGGTPPPPTGGGGTPPPPSGGGTTTQPAAPTVLPIRFADRLGSAKKAKKKKSLVVKGTADQPIKNLVLKLRKLGGKGKTFASGKAASVKPGSVKVKMKPSKKLKKGVYTLLATGFVDGKKLQVGQKVTVGS